jgi:phosphatidylglycerophosphate synthase
MLCRKTKTMFSFFRKHKLTLDIIATIVFALGSIMYAIEYFETENKKMKLFGAIIFGIMTIFKLVDVIERFKTKVKIEKIERH